MIPFQNLTMRSAADLVADLKAFSTREFDREARSRFDRELEKIMVAFIASRVRKEGGVQSQPSDDRFSSGATLSRALADAFPHFDRDAANVTPEKIKQLGAEYDTMMVSWAPVPAHLTFFDEGGVERRLDWEDDDNGSGGWCIPAEATWSVLDHEKPQAPTSPSPDLVARNKDLTTVLKKLLRAIFVPYDPPETPPFREIIEEANALLKSESKP